MPITLQQGKPMGVPLKRFLTYVCQLAREDGFVTKKMATNQQTVCTGEQAWDIIANPETLMTFAARQTDADVGMAEDIISFSNDHLADATEPYLVRLRQELAWNSVHKENAAMIASIYKVYTDACATTGTSEYVGRLREKRYFKLTFVGKSRTKNMRGNQPSWRYTFLEGGRNIVTWYSTTERSFVPNWTYAIQAEVSQHTVYRNEKQTQIKNGAVAGIVN